MLGSCDGVRAQGPDSAARPDSRVQQLLLVRLAIIPRALLPPALFCSSSPAAGSGSTQLNSSQLNSTQLNALALACTAGEAAPLSRVRHRARRHARTAKMRDVAPPNPVASAGPRSPVPRPLRPPRPRRPRRRQQPVRLVSRSQRQRDLPRWSGAGARKPAWYPAAQAAQAACTTLCARLRTRPRSGATVISATIRTAALLGSVTPQSTSHPSPSSEPDLDLQYEHT